MRYGSPVARWCSPSAPAPSRRASPFRCVRVTFSNAKDRDVQLYDLTSGERLLALDLDPGRRSTLGVPVQGVALDPSGTRMFVRAQHWGMFDVSTGERLWGDESPEGECCGLEAPIFSRDGRLLFGFHGTRLEARQALTGELFISVESGSSPGFVATPVRGPSGPRPPDRPARLFRGRERRDRMGHGLGANVSARRGGRDDGSAAGGVRARYAQRRCRRRRAGGEPGQH